MRAFAFALLLSACAQGEKPSPSMVEKSPQAVEKSPSAGEKPPPPAGKSCIDRELEKRGLNQFGDPPDTMYAGGTPLFDEATGKRTDRDEYVRAHHPDIAKACPAH